MEMNRTAMDMHDMHGTHDMHEMATATDMHEMDHGMNHMHGGSVSFAQVLSQPF